MAFLFMIPCRCCGVKTPEVDDFGKPLCPECCEKERSSLDQPPTFDKALENTRQSLRSFKAFLAKPID